MLCLSWVMNIIITYKETEILDSQPFIFNHDKKHLFFHVWLMVGWLLSFSRKFFTFCYKWILNHLTLFFLEKHKLHILWLLRLYLKRFDYCFEKFSLEPPIPVSIEKEWVFLFQEVSSVFCCSLLFSSLGFSSYFIFVFLKVTSWIRQFSWIMTLHDMTFCSTFIIATVESRSL